MEGIGRGSSEVGKGEACDGVAWLTEITAERIAVSQRWAARKEWSELAKEIGKGCNHSLEGDVTEA